MEEDVAKEYEESPEHLIFASASVATGYFGTLDFLSCQSTFDAVFPNLTILDPFPALVSDPSESLSTFSDILSA